MPVDTKKAKTAEFTKCGQIRKSRLILAIQRNGKFSRKNFTGNGAMVRRLANAVCPIGRTEATFGNFCKKKATTTIQWFWTKAATAAMEIM